MTLKHQHSNENKASIPVHSPAISFVAAAIMDDTESSPKFIAGLAKLFVLITLDDMMHCVWLRQITYILIMKIKHWSGTGDHIGSDMRRWRKTKPLGWDGGSVALITHHPSWCSIHITQHPTNLISHMISHGKGYFRAETIITFPRWEDLCGNSAYSGRR